MLKWESRGDKVSARYLRILRGADQDQMLDTGVLLHVFEQFTKILKEYPF